LLLIESMKIGIALEGTRSARDLARLAVRVEALGFDSLWAPDHVAYSQPICDPLQVLAACAASTTTIRLGTCVYLPALRHPTLVAKMVASLDWLCDGRFTLGIGIGGEFPAEFAACGVPLAERGARTNESIGILRALWSGQEPPRDGRFFDIPPVSLQPLPAQPGGPPIWVGGRSEAALRRAAWLSDGYLGYFLDAAGLRARMARIRLLREQAPEPARRTARVHCALMAFARVDEDRDRALSVASRRLGALYGSGMESAPSRFGVVGSTSECRERVAALAAAGVDDLLLSPIVDGDLDAQLERFAALQQP
jgi:probable F420-dependent oxidoreductase